MGAHDAFQSNLKLTLGKEMYPIAFSIELRRGMLSNKIGVTCVIYFSSTIKNAKPDSAVS
jgi:hypothetical protein